MTFKQDWEKSITNQQLVPEALITHMIKLAYPTKKLISQEVIAGGLANINIKIQLADELQPRILRIYLREKDAALREQKLREFLGSEVPMPAISYIADYDCYRFAIAEFIPGITLRELLLSVESNSIAAIMFEVGIILSKIAAHKFPASGFFDKELNIVIKTNREDYLVWGKECLLNAMVISNLAAIEIVQINLLLDKFINFLPSNMDKNLVHGDFDPANILVAKIDGTWKVTGILDWEFAFSGSVLNDVANMLRYAHQMPLEFTTEFLQGLKKGGIKIPTNWNISSDILNLLALLDCLSRSDPNNSSNRCADIHALIKRIIKNLETYK